MEAISRERKGGDEAMRRSLHIVYFLSRKGKIEQPHLITVHQYLNNINIIGVHLRDFKRWLSELRGKEMSESFSWSYKRKYKAGYIWQDLTDNDLITPTSCSEYVLKGSLLISPIKTIEQLKEEEEEEEEEAKLILAMKSRHETFQIEKNISSTEVNEDSPLETSASTSSLCSDEAKRRTAVIKEKQSCKEIVSKENESRYLNGVINIKEIRNDNGARKWASILRNFMRCRTAETKNSVVRAISNQSDSRIVEAAAAILRSWETKGIKGSMKVTQEAIQV